MSRTPLAVAATGVTIEVGERRVLDDVHLALAPGTFTALTGPSGAGKSTLLWVLAGALTPTSGTVTYAGRPLPGPGSAAGEGIVLVPQGMSLVVSLTARENLIVPLLVGRVPVVVARERSDAVLGQVGLGDVATHLVEELSGGQQQRVAVGRGLAQRPNVLLADEPTSELDASSRDVIVGLLAAEAADGAVVLLATHDPWCAEQAEAEYHLDEGRLRRVR